MNIYLIRQEENVSNGSFDGAVVNAGSEAEAQLTDPTSGSEWYKNAWCDPKFVTVELIGKAAEDAVAGVVISSFNGLSNGELVRNAQSQIGKMLVQLEKDTGFFVKAIEVKTPDRHTGSDGTQTEYWKKVDIDVRPSAGTDWEEETYGDASEEQSTLNAQ